MLRYYCRILHLALLIFSILLSDTIVFAMPELPEVESMRKSVAETCICSYIVRVETKEQGGGPRNGMFDDIVIESDKSSVDTHKREASVLNETEKRLCSVLLNNTVTEVKRKGKHIWFEFSRNRDIAVLFHFGMTGSFVIRDHPIPTYKAFKIGNNAEWPPKFTKLEMEFSNGICIAFCDPRRLGRIKIRSDPLHCSPLSELGLDPVLDSLPTPAELLTMLKPFSAPIKAILLDQEKIFCGIGNYLADEILYQAKIHPETKSNHINERGLRQLLLAIQNILTIAISANARYELFPKDWLFHYRWDKNKSKLQTVVMPNGAAVVFETHGGRTSAIVPSIQMKNGSYMIHSSNSALVVEKDGSVAEVNTKGKEAKRKLAKEDITTEQQLGPAQEIVEPLLKTGRKASKVDMAKMIGSVEKSDQVDSSGANAIKKAVAPIAAVSTASIQPRLTASLAKMASRVTRSCKIL
jgi:formamidopyrimidine-DNA glycosylase